MKYQKKKSKLLRKERKANKKKTQQPFAKRLTPARNKFIRKLAEKLTNERRFDLKIINKSFLCNECWRYYCIAFNDTLIYCDECGAESYCIKDIRGFRDCAECLYA